MNPYFDNCRCEEALATRKVIEEHLVMNTGAFNCRAPPKFQLAACGAELNMQAAASGEVIVLQEIMCRTNSDHRT